MRCNLSLEVDVTYLLEGIKVIDLANFLAAPVAGTLMADYGAQVIKVEAPGGDGYRRLHGGYETDYNWQLTSRNKQDIVLNIRSAPGMEVLMKLLCDADVLLTNFRNDQLDSYGLNFESLHEKFPRLIVAQLTGFGNEGPDRLRRGYDSTAWFARTGMMRLMKAKDQPPVFPAGGVGDHSTGMSLFAGIMTAMYKREKDGVGSFVETSLIANGVWANGMQLQGAIAGLDIAEIVQRKDNRTPFAYVYETRDEHHLCLVLTNPVKEWPEVANALGHPEWLEDERFIDMRTLMRNRAALRIMFADVFRAQYLKDVCLALDEHQLTYGVVEGLTEVVRDAHLIENEVIVQTQSDDPNFAWTIANPLKISNVATQPIGDPPEMGEHTRALLSDHGYSEAQIEQLITDKVVFSND